jgi:hypothetical protein
MHNNVSLEFSLRHVPSWSTLLTYVCANDHAPFYLVQCPVFDFFAGVTPRFLLGITDIL